MSDFYAFVFSFMLVYQWNSHIRLMLYAVSQGHDIIFLK